jgi:hypothetical protein
MNINQVNLLFIKQRREYESFTAYYQSYCGVM